MSYDSADLEFLSPDIDEAELVFSPVEIASENITLESTIDSDEIFFFRR